MRNFRDRLNYVLSIAWDYFVGTILTLIGFCAILSVLYVLTGVLGYVSYLLNGFSFGIPPDVEETTFYGRLVFEGFGVGFVTFAFGALSSIVGFFLYKICQFFKWLFTGNRNIFW